MLQLYFIRHGQSENNAIWDSNQDVKSFVPDPELTPIGHQQAHLLGRHLSLTDSGFLEPTWDPQNASGFGITHLYTSLMLRAVATGTKIASALNLPLVAWTDLHERGGLVLDERPDDDPVGYPGPNRAFFEKHYPGLVLPGELKEAGWWSRPWENPIDRRERAQRVVSQLFERHGHENDRVAFISHGGFYIHFLAALFGFPDQSGWWFLMNNTAITRIDFRSEEISLVYHNRVVHLPSNLIT